MDWSDERYVRLYTRDTADWLALSFEAQALLALLLRKVDRAGVLELGRHGRRAVAIALGHPAKWPVLDPALTELEADGCVVLDQDKLVVRNYIEAQSAVQNDALRQRESRERRRANGLSRFVTESHAPSQGVTPSHSVPSCAVLDSERDLVGLAPDALQLAASPAAPDPDTSTRAVRRPPELLIRARSEAALYVEWFNRVFGRQFTVSGANVSALKNHLSSSNKAKHTQGALRLVALHLKGQWASDVRMQQHLVPSTLLKLDKFEERLDAARQADPDRAAMCDRIDAEPLEHRLRAALEKTAPGPVADAIAASLRDLGLPLLRTLAGGKP